LGQIGEFGKAIAYIPQNQTMQTAKTQSQATKKILIVEDEGEVCLLLNLMLQDKEMDLDHVKTLDSAEKYLQKQQPSVIILDNKLPDGWGVDFISYVKTNYPAIKIVMITGFSGSVKDIALQNGVDSFIEKPFTRSQIYNSVQAFIN
jgi:two-component system OmpR family response regulator